MELPAARMVIVPARRGRNVSRATPAAFVVAPVRTPAPRALTRTRAIGARFWSRTRTRTFIRTPTEAALRVSERFLQTTGGWNGATGVGAGGVTGGG
jgi:hypothetical protein